MKILTVVTLCVLMSATASALTFSAAYDDSSGASAFELPTHVTMNRHGCDLDEEARAAARFYWHDLTGDDVPEMVVRVQGDDSDGDWTCAATLIYALLNGSYSLYWVDFNGEYLGDLWFADVTGDGVSEAVIIDYSGAHHRNLDILGYGPLGFNVLFSNGSSCGVVIVNTDQPAATITIGRENWANPDFCYATSGEMSLLEVWRWDGHDFVFDANASTVPHGQSDREAIEAASRHFVETLEMIRDAKRGDK